MASDIISLASSTPATSQLLGSKSSSNIEIPNLHSTPKLKYVIVDTGVFIRLKRLDTLTQNILTTPGVAQEIRDSRARQNLITFIETPQIRQPAPQYIKRVKDFTKQSGDFNRLSVTDLQLIALTLMISEEQGDTSTLKTEPLSTELGSNKYSEFEWGPKSLIHTQNNDNFNENYTQNNHNLTDNHNLSDDDTHDFLQESESWSNDEDTWITEENIHRIGHSVSKPVNILVACLTTDYTIQNVLLKMGLHLISIDGYEITSVKDWILKCQGCHNLEYDSNKLFCSRCGNNALVSLSVITDLSGQSTIHLSKRPPKLRGIKYSLPNPNKSKNLILREDQMMMGGRDREMRHKMKLYEKNIIEKDPFRPDSLINQQGWWHRNFTPSGKLEFQGFPKIEIGMGKGNPNSNRWMKNKKKNYKK